MPGVGSWTPETALEAARMAGDIPFPEFLSRCLPEGTVTRERFDIACDAYDAAKAEREIHGLPEAANPEEAA